jgi:hypothetical protein
VFFVFGCLGLIWVVFWLCGLLWAVGSGYLRACIHGVLGAMVVADVYSRNR